MRKRYSEKFKITLWVLFGVTFFLFLTNLAMLVYISPSIKSVLGKAGEIEQGILTFQILPPGVSPPSVTSGTAESSGGGGGGRGEIGRGSQLGGYNELTSAIEISLGEGEFFSFSFGKVGHSISVLELDREKILIIIKSREIRLLIYVGEVQEVDFENDGRKDISVALKSVDMASKRAEIIITPLYTPSSPFEVTPDSLSVSIVAGEKVLRSLKIRNNLPKKITLSSEVVLLSAVLELPKSFALELGEEKDLEVKIGPAEKGLLTGKVKLFSGAYLQEIPVAIDVKTSNFLFDVSAVISSAYRRVVGGTVIPIEINMQQVAKPVKIDVTVSYIVKDFSGVVYLDESETLSIEGTKSYIKNLDTAGLPIGKYIAGVEVQYPGAFATSSSQFEVISQEEAEALRRVISKYMSIIAMVLVALSIILAVWLLLRQKLEEKLMGRKLQRKV